MDVATTTAPKPFCFVLMPFDAAFNDVYKLGIKLACDKAGTYCERVDEQIFHESILRRVYNQIAKADFIVADMTGRNPNVFYEVGYAHALGKPTILLTKNADDIPFDLQHYPHIVYKDSITSLQDELCRRLQYFATQPKPERTTIGIELYVGKTSLSADNTIVEYPSGQIPNATITIRNSSTLTYREGEFKIAVIWSSELVSCSMEGNTSGLPDGGSMHVVPYFDTLFPEEYRPFDLRFRQVAGGDNEVTHLAVTLRVLTSAGSRDFSLTLVRSGPGRI